MTFTNASSYFETVSEVTLSWDKIKRIPSYDEHFGVALFTRMFELAPDEWNVFSWGPEDFQNKTPVFLEYSKTFVRMLDMAIDMLGPDMEIVEDELYQLGTMHKRYGVTPRKFELMGQALVDTLQKILGKRSFTDRTGEAWNEIYGFMSMTMIQGAASM